MLDVEPGALFCCAPVEVLMDPGAASHVRLAKVIGGYKRREGHAATEPCALPQRRSRRNLLLRSASRE